MKTWTFKKSLLVLAIVYALVIASGLWYFWKTLARYEEKHPIGAMNAYFAALSAGDTEKILADSDFPFDAVNTREAYIRYLQEKYTGDGWQYAEISSEETGIYRYDVYQNDQRRGQLTLIQQADGYRVYSDWTLRDPLTICSPVTPLVNGVSLFAFQQGKPAVVSPFADAGGTLPMAATYTVRTLLPEVVTISEGTAVLTLQKDGAVWVTAQPNAQDRTALTAFAERVARTYACYISKDAAFDELAALLETGTPFMRYIRAYDNYWYNQHTAVAFENMQVAVPIQWGRDAFTIDVSFDFVVSRTYDSHTYPTAYRIACRRAGSGFKVTNIQSL